MCIVKDIFSPRGRDGCEQGERNKVLAGQMVFECSIGDAILELFSRDQDPAGSILSHWSDTSWNIKMLYFNQEELVGNRDSFNSFLKTCHKMLGLETVCLGNLILNRLFQ